MNCDCLLVFPPDSPYYIQSASRHSPQLSPPLGIGYLASPLKSSGFRVEALDLRLACDPEAVFKEALCKLSPGMVGFSVPTPSYHAACALAEYTKAICPDTPVIIGGYHVSALPDEVLEEGFFDVLCIGEGEETIVEVAECLLKRNGSLESIAGIAYGKSCFNPPRTMQHDLDVFSSPELVKFPIEQYQIPGTIVTGRGCYRKCIFCTIGSGAKVVRFHSIHRVLSEIEYYQAHFGVSHFVFYDDNLSANRRRLKELCRALRDAGPDITFGCELVSSEVDEELAGLLVEAGCHNLLIGAESGNEDVLRSTGKGIGLQDIERAVKLLSDAGLKYIACSFIVGHPTDTPGTVRETFKFAEYLKQLGATKIWLNPLIPYPGTEVYRSADELGVKILTRDWRQYVPFRIVMETECLTKQMIADLLVEGLLMVES